MGFPTLSPTFAPVSSWRGRERKEEVEEREEGEELWRRRGVVEEETTVKETGLVLFFLSLSLARTHTHTHTHLLPTQANHERLRSSA